MKAVLLLAFAACAAPKPTSSTPASTASTQPPKMEMQSYQLVLLRRGPVWTAEQTPETQKLFEGHMANIKAMAATCKLVVAGPIDSPATDRTALAGIFIFNAERAAVEEMLKQDPAIAVGRLVPEIHDWYGDAGLAKRCTPAAT